MLGAGYLLARLVTGSPASVASPDNAGASAWPTLPGCRPGCGTVGTVILERINSPADLKALTYEELDTLAIEIRQFIVDSIAEAGSGHLGSNLGVVELTLALHRVFDSP